MCVLCGTRARTRVCRYVSACASECVCVRARVYINVCVCVFVCACVCVLVILQSSRFGMFTISYASHEAKRKLRNGSVGESREPILFKRPRLLFARVAGSSVNKSFVIYSSKFLVPRLSWGILVIGDNNTEVLLTLALTNVSPDTASQRASAILVRRRSFSCRHVVQVTSACLFFFTSYAGNLLISSLSFCFVLSLCLCLSVCSSVCLSLSLSLSASSLALLDQGIQTQCTERFCTPCLQRCVCFAASAQVFHGTGTDCAIAVAPGCYPVLSA